MADCKTGPVAVEAVVGGSEIVDSHNVRVVQFGECTRFACESLSETGVYSDLLENAGVAITPGIDFGSHKATRHVRFAYTTYMDDLELGVARLQKALGAGAL